MWKALAILAALLTAVPAQANEGFDHRHRAWGELLEKHVVWREGGVASAVDYPGFVADKTALASYLADLSAVSETDYNRWSKDHQLAFLINAYNAFTIKLILDHWPLESIKDIGGWFRSPWKMRFFTLLGKGRHLDWIEHEVIRKPGNFNEPRIHFAVNCAAIGCPALRPEAYVGERLSSQLEDQTRRFLADRSRNRVDGDILRLSSLFNWYREDFERGWQGVESLADFLLPHAQTLGIPPSNQDRQSFDQLPLEFLDYDWRLNGVPPP